MKFKIFLASLILSLVASAAFAGAVNVPNKHPLVTVNVPDAWEPEVTAKGVAIESPDEVATLFFEAVASEKSMNALIEENIEWLTTDQGVKIIPASKKDLEIVVGGIKSSLLEYDANNKEYGPSKVGFIFTPVDKGLLVITYWIVNKGAQKHEATISKIFASVKQVQ